MRSCEYLRTDGERKTKLLRLRNIRFYNNRKEIDKIKQTNLLLQASSVNITFESQKNGEKDEAVSMHANQKELCPVIAWASIVTRILDYPGTTLCQPVNTILVGKQMSLITSKEVIKHIRATVKTIGKDTLGFGPDDVGVYSIRSSFAMFLYTQFVRTDKIMIQGRWKSDAFLIYLRKQVEEFSKGLSDLMIHTKNEYFNVPDLQTEDTHEIVSNPNDPRTRHLFSFASSLNTQNGPGSQSTQTRPSFHLWS